MNENILCLLIVLSVCIIYLLICKIFGAYPFKKAWIHDKRTKGNKLKPCDCRDREDTKKLQEQGISFNEDSLVIKPNYVELTIGCATIKTSMRRFKQFAEWFLSEQELNDKTTEGNIK